MFESEDFETGNIQLNTGDVLVIFTDGLTEAKNNNHEFYGEKRLMEVIGKNQNLTAEEMLQVILDSVNIFQGKVNQRDDITIVVLKAN